MRRAVVGVDGSDESRAAVQWCASTLQRGTTVIAVCGMAALGEFAVSLPPLMLAEADLRACLGGKWTAPPRAAGLRCEQRLVHARQVHALIEVARASHAELLVVGQYRHGAVPDAVWGPGRSRLLRDPPCPVVIVPVEWRARGQARAHVGGLGRDVFGAPDMTRRRRPR